MNKELTVKELTSRAGKASVKKRFEGKSKEEISKEMSEISKKRKIIVEKLYSK